MNSYIFLVGKSDPHLEAASAIRRLGYNVGLFHDASIELKHPEAFDMIISLTFGTLDLSRIDLQGATIAGLVCTYENYVTAKASLAAYLSLPGASARSAAMSTDKYLMREAFLQADPSITPRFEKIVSEDALLDFAATTTYPLIIKPTNLVKSLLVLRCNDKAELLHNFRYAQATIGDLYKKYAIHDRQPELIVEEFIKGKSCSIAAFVDNTGEPHFCKGIVGITTASEHGADDNYLYSRTLPLELSHALSQKLFDVAKKGIVALDMRSTPAHVELMYDGDDVKIIEIGARIGGYRPRMYGYGYGLDLVAQEVQLAIGKSPLLDGTFRAYSAVYELFPDREGAFKEILGQGTMPEYTYFSIKPKTGQHIGPAKYGYKAAVVIIIAHEDKTTFEALCKSVDALRVQVV